MQSGFEGIAKLRRGILILIIALIVFIGGAVSASFISGSNIMSFLLKMAYIPKFSNIDSASIVSILALFISLISVSPGLLISVALAHLVLGVSELVSIILAVIGYLYIRRGFKSLNAFGKGIRIGDLAVKLFFIFVILLIAGNVIFDGINILAINLASTNFKTANELTKIANLSSTAIEGIGFLLLFTSDLLLGIGFYQLGGMYREIITKIGGILALATGALGILFLLVSSSVSEVTPFIYLLSLIVLYVGLMRIRIAQPTPFIQPAQVQQPTVQQPQPVQKTVQQPTVQQPTFVPQTVPAQTQPSPIYQVGQGVIRGDGLAFVTLYTSTQAMINSVKVEGTALRAVMVNPVILQPGQNAIAIKFDNVSQLIPGNSYIITIGLKIGGNLTELRAVANYYP